METGDGNAEPPAPPSTCQIYGCDLALLTLGLSLGSSGIPMQQDLVSPTGFGRLRICDALWQPIPKAFHSLRFGEDGGSQFQPAIPSLGEPLWVLTASRQRKTWAANVIFIWFQRGKQPSHLSPKEREDISSTGYRRRSHHVCIWYLFRITSHYTFFQWFPNISNVRDSCIFLLPDLVCKTWFAMCQGRKRLGGFLQPVFQRRWPSWLSFGCDMWISVPRLLVL